MGVEKMVTGNDPANSVDALAERFPAEQPAHVPSSTRIGNPDEERDRPRRREVPQLEVEDLNQMGSLLDLDMRTLDKNYTYKFVNRSANIKMARAKQKGYIFVDPEREPDIKTQVGESPDIQDGRYVVGDTVLMRCPRAKERARNKAKRKRALDRLGSQVRRFKKTADKVSQDLGEPVEVITDKE
jgi:hypothetical protein